MRGIGLVVAAALAAGPALAQGKRSGAPPCRQGALALIAMLDDKDDRSAAYRHAYTAVVETCGPASKSAAPPAAGGTERAACRDLALKLLDLIEENKLNTQAFARARATFAKACAPP